MEINEDFGSGYDGLLDDDEDKHKTQIDEEQIQTKQTSSLSYIVRRRKQPKQEIIKETTTTQKGVFSLIKTLTGQANILTVPVAFIKYTGNIHSALFLSQLIYWTERTNDGWIYKTYNDWENEIYIKEYLIRKAKKTLEEKDVLETKVKKIHGNPTLHYRLKQQEFLDSFLYFLSNVNVKLKEPKCKIKGTYNRTEITSEITSKDIYSTFLQEWNKNTLIKHKKITSKRKRIIDKILKTNDYSLEEIFKAFQNYSVVINSDDYFWDYKWTMEDFLQRGLDKFIDESQPLDNFKNKGFSNNNQNNNQNQQLKNPLANPTRESLNLFPKEDIDTWGKYYSDFADQLTNADIWKINYTPNKNLIFPKLLAQKTWLNNLIEIDGFGRVMAVIGYLHLLVKRFIDYTYWELNKENAWLKGITEAHLAPNGKFFKEFIRDAGNGMTALDGGIKIRSRGWGDDEDQKIENPAEIMLREKKEREKDEERERRYAKQEKEKSENVQIMLKYMKKYLSDIEKIDIKILDLSRWYNNLNEQDFKDFVIEVEKRHQVNPRNRGYGYIPIWRKELENLK